MWSGTLCSLALLLPEFSELISVRRCLAITETEKINFEQVRKNGRLWEYEHMEFLVCSVKAFQRFCFDLTACRRCKILKEEQRKLYKS